MVDIMLLLQGVVFNSDEKLNPYMLTFGVLNWCAKHTATFVPHVLKNIEEVSFSMFIFLIYVLLFFFFLLHTRNFFPTGLHSSLRSSRETLVSVGFSRLEKKGVYCGFTGYI